MRLHSSFAVEFVAKAFHNGAKKVSVFADCIRVW